MTTTDILKKLSNSYGIGNNYDSVTNSITDILGKDNMGIDINKNLVYNIKTELQDGKTYKKIMLDAHIDEIGFIVTSITEEGYIKLANVGGVDKRLLLSKEVLILGKKKVLGVVSCVAPHLLDKISNKNEYMDINDMFIDVGLTKKDAEQLISIGDFCVFNESCQCMVNNLVTGKSLDNRIGCTTLIEVYNEIKNINLKNLDIYFCFTVKEELSGAVGALTITNNIEPDIAIVVDVSFAKAPNVEDYKCGKMGNGVMIGFSPILDNEIFDTLKSLANKNNIKNQLEIMSNRTGTNADGIVAVKNGIKTSLLSIPIKNMHSTIEMVLIDDIISTKNLIVEYLKEVSKC